tara:strand:+ start:273 stop:467 length:195 start_codon:yes stop_codon:yes gene_type:complete
MTLSSKSKKLDQKEISSISNAVKDAGIQQIHPEKMEAYAEHLVSELRNTHEKPQTWRTGGALEE